MENNNTEQKVAENKPVVRKPVDRKRLEERLNMAYTARTSSDQVNWTKKNSAWGQCAVTALIVNDYLGGEIVRANAVLPDGSRIPHYFNKINGEELDLTRKQFPEGTEIPEGIPKKKEFNSTREYILSAEQTQKRYDLLKKRIEILLS